MTFTIVAAGCGALNSQTIMHLASPEVQVVLIDDDRIEPNNVSTGTTIYSHQHLRALKANVLAELYYRKTGTPATPFPHTLERSQQVMEFNPDLVIDGFDNWEARRLVSGLGVPTLHQGVSIARVGMVEWDEDYKIPARGFARGENPVCTNQLGRRILAVTALATALVVMDFIATGARRSLMCREDGRIIE